MNKISFGVRVPNSGPLSSIENIVNAAKSAEELGFDAIWVHDHVVWSSEMHKHHISWAPPRPSTTPRMPIFTKPPRCFRT